MGRKTPALPRMAEKAEDKCLGRDCFRMVDIIFSFSKGTIRVQGICRWSPIKYEMTVKTSYTSCRHYFERTHVGQKSIGKNCIHQRPICSDLQIGLSTQRALVNDIGLSDLEAVRLILSGNSVIDWDRANFRTVEEVNRFFKGTTFRLG